MSKCDSFFGWHGIGYVIHVHAGIGLPHSLDLVRHRERRAGQTERVAARERGLHRNLGDDLWILRLRHVDRGEAHRRGFVGEEQHALAIWILPQREPFAAFAGAVQVAVADDLHVAGFRHCRNGIGTYRRR